MIKEDDEEKIITAFIAPFFSIIVLGIILIFFKESGSPIIIFASFFISIILNFLIDRFAPKIELNFVKMFLFNLCCSMTIFVLYYHNNNIVTLFIGGIQILMNNIHTTIATILAIAGAVSIAISATARYFRSKRFGIPFGITKASPSEITELFVELFGVIFFGILLPSLISVGLIYLLLNENPKIIIISFFFLNVFSIALGILSLESVRNWTFKHKDKNLIKALKISGVSSIISAFFSSVYLTLEIDQNNIEALGYTYKTIILIVIIIVYIIIVLCFSGISIFKKINGEYQEVGTLTIDGINYLLAIKLSDTIWICVKINEIENSNGTIIKFVDGLFKIVNIADKDITTIKNPILEKSSELK